MNDGRVVTYATYSTPCAVCRQPMAIGSLIELHAAARRWTHAECAAGELATCALITKLGKRCRGVPLLDAERCALHATPAEREAAAAARAERRAEREAEVVRPMGLADLLDYLATSTRELQADLWTMRDAIDAELAGDSHALAVAALATLAGLYDDATDTVRTLADKLAIPLPADLYGPSSC